MNRKSDAVSGGGEFTAVAPEVAPVLAQYKIEPNEFLPMTGPDQACPYSGLKRGALYCLWRDDEIETVSARRKGLRRDDGAAVNDLNELTRIPPHASSGIASLGR